MMGILNLLDILLIIVLFLSIFFGILKGFIRELFSLAFFIIGVVFLFYYEVGELFMPYLKNREVSNFAGFITIFVVVSIIGSLVTFLIKKLFSFEPMKSIDRILGGVFGLLRGILIASIIVFALIVFPVNDNLVTKSRLSPYILTTIEVCIHFLPAKYQEKIQSIRTG